MPQANLDQLVNLAIRQLTRAEVQSPRLDAQLLLAHVLNKDRAWLIGHGTDALDDETSQKFATLIKQREAGEPVHRIIGRREFWGMELELSPDTLEPRPDTECLVEAVLRWLDEDRMRHKSLRLADIGTGSGAIALALLHELPNVEIDATDISVCALETATRNAERLGMASRFHPRPGSYCQPLDGLYDAIISNPPYIRSKDMASLQKEVRLFDPYLALDGGPDGCDAYRALITEAKDYLTPAGNLFLEIGHNQASDVTEIAVQNGWQLVAISNDLSGAQRVLHFSPLVSSK